MSPSSSTPMRGGSSAGELAGRRMRTSSWTPSNRRFMTEGLPAAAASSITAIAASNMFRSSTPSVSPKPGSSLPSAASANSYDNALAETINGLYKAEVIHRRGPWRNFEAVEFATLEWVDWFNNRRLLEPIGFIPPAVAEERYFAMLNETAMAGDSNKMASGKAGAVQTDIAPVIKSLRISRWPILEVFPSRCCRQWTAVSARARARPQSPDLTALRRRRF